MKIEYGGEIVWERKVEWDKVPFGTKFEHDLTAKQVKCFFEANAFSKAFKCLSMVAFE